MSRFDLARAKAGEPFEVYTDGEWTPGTLIGVFSNGKLAVETAGYWAHHIDEEDPDLRMAARPQLGRLKKAADELVSAYCRAMPFRPSNLDYLVDQLRAASSEVGE